MTNSEPAFPCSTKQSLRGASPCSGMSLRDYFAAKAMQALVSLDTIAIKDVVKESYTLADAMMEAREK